MSNPYLIELDFGAWASRYPYLKPLFEIPIGIFGTSSLNLLWAVCLVFTVILVVCRGYFIEADRSKGLKLRSYLSSRSSFTMSEMKVDFIFLFLNSFFFSISFVLSTISIFSLGPKVSGFLTQTFGEWPSQPSPPLNGFLIAIIGILGFLILDLTRYLLHRMSHRIEFLWKFHKVHHSSRGLNTFTAFREHPFLQWLILILVAMPIGVYQGIAQYFIPSVVHQPGWLEGNLLSYLVLQTFFILGHFHIPISYGSLDKWVISPAVHSIHHSANPNHYDRNFGGVFTLWDRIFGTYHRPTREDLGTLVYGTDDYLGSLSVSRLYLNPLYYQLPVGLRTQCLQTRKK